MRRQSCSWELAGLALALGLTTWWMGGAFHLGVGLGRKGLRDIRTSWSSLLTASGGEPVPMVITCRKEQRGRVRQRAEVRNVVGEELGAEDTNLPESFLWDSSVVTATLHELTAWHSDALNNFILTIINQKDINDQSTLNFVGVLLSAWNNINLIKSILCECFQPDVCSLFPLTIILPLLWVSSTSQLSKDRLTGDSVVLGLLWCWIEIITGRGERSEHVERGENWVSTRV